MRKEAFYIELSKGWEQPISLAEFNRLCDLVVADVPSLSTQKVDKCKEQIKSDRQAYDC
ncbi:hypothetical protein L1D31_21575 [Vibrio sp. Isolate23]|uniref:hypothetical protein n=1 Tax=Vibrio sp. Isolate23 TaxID=2908533 RepID=UPI001EFDAB01|nr:hypothetical protein [Vibrio sp. Isolate23]MCG9685115.1 hypothetical protein [Vibrio sp. Isolate23]